MYYLKKRITIAGAHQLKLPYTSKCNNLHGHNWIIEVTVHAYHVNENGMVVDFTQIKNQVMKLDHSNLNDHLLQPTAENIAKWILDDINDLLDSDIDSFRRGTKCIRVTVQESEGNEVTYENLQDS